MRFSMDFFNAFNHPNFDATFIQGTGSNNGSGVFYNGSGVYCGAPNGAGKYQPCSPSNSVISAYGTTNPGIGGANPGFGSGECDQAGSRTAVRLEVNLLTDAASRRRRTFRRGL